MHFDHLPINQESKLNLLCEIQLIFVHTNYLGFYCLKMLGVFEKSPERGFGMGSEGKFLDFLFTVSSMRTLRNARFNIISEFSEIRSLVPNGEQYTLHIVLTPFDINIPS